MIRSTIKVGLTICIASVALTAPAMAAQGGVPGPSQQTGRGFDPASDTEGNHCYIPVGDDRWIDLNEVSGRSEQFVETRFCPTAEAGEHVIPACTWEVSKSNGVFPAGYEPSEATPAEDFMSKLEAVKIVMDPGTRQERTYYFAPSPRLFNVEQADDVFGEYSLGGISIGLMPTLPPQSIGDHVAEMWVVMNAAHCDGYGEDPAWNCLPEGESFYVRRRFTVTQRERQ